MTPDLSELERLVRQLGAPDKHGVVLEKLLNAAPALIAELLELREQATHSSFAAKVRLLRECQAEVESLRGEVEDLRRPHMPSTPADIRDVEFVRVQLEKSMAETERARAEVAALKAQVAGAVALVRSNVCEQASCNHASCIALTQCANELAAGGAK